MYVLTICLSPEDMEDDPNLNTIALVDESSNTVIEAIKSRYDLDEDSFHFYEYQYDTPNGSFQTAEKLDPLDDEDEIRLNWEFEIFKI